MLAKGRILSLVCAASLGLLAAPALATPVHVTWSFEFPLAQTTGVGTFTFDTDDLAGNPPTVLVSTSITLTSPIDSFSTTVEMPFVFDPDGSGTVAFDTLFFGLGSISVPCPAPATCSSTGGVASLLPSVFVNGPFAETEITWGELGLPGPFFISVGDTISFQYLVPEPRLALLLGAPVVLAAGRRRRALS